MDVTEADLDAFVAQVDREGGPATALASSRWQSFRYVPTIQVDTSSDPDGELYFAQMLGLYEEIARRKLNQAETEFTPLDPLSLVALESPYHFASPSERAVHYLRLARAFHDANLPKGARVLDMGCGWGLSSEFLAQLGFIVEAVDINELFVDLVRRRASRLGLPIRVSNVSFDDYRAEPESFDAVVFYECFHHAVRPGQLLERVCRWLKPGGKLVLAGEPIQSLYWPDWGLRLDALSVYCIRKFGWFESGWSSRYLQRIVSRSGLFATIREDSDPIGPYLIGLNEWVLDKSRLSKLVDQSQWWFESEHLVSGRAGSTAVIPFVVPGRAKTLCIEIFNFKPVPQELSIDMGDGARATRLAPGRNLVKVALDSTRQRDVGLSLSCKTWCPHDVLGNGDQRQLGFHLRQMSFE